MKRLVAILVLVLLVTFAVAQQFARIDVRLGGSSGTVGGHSPHGASDYYDASEGVYSVAQNITPLDAQPGALLTRRSVQRTDSLRYPSARCVGFGYVAQTEIDGNVDKGAFLFQHDTTLTQMYRLKEYDESDVSEFSKDELSTYDTPTTWATASGELEPGSGLWYASNVASRLWMPGGLVRRSDAEDNYDAGGPAASFMEHYYKMPGTAGAYEGIFYRPTEATGIDWAENYHITPEKPWTSMSGSTNYYHTYKVLFGSPTQPNYWMRTGKNYWGEYKYWVYPVDEDGELGPPLITEEIYIARDEEESDGTNTYTARGLSLVHEFQTIDNDRIRPSIRSLRIYGRYTNPDPLNSIWTGGYPAGFGLDVAPTNKTGIIAEIDFNGRQFDPASGETIPAQGAAATIPRSTRFNYFPTTGEDGWITAEKTSDTTFTINRYNGRISGGQFKPSVQGDVDSVYVEIDGYAGVWYTEGYVSPPNNIDEIAVDSALPAGWAVDELRRVRFCFPWVRDDANDYRIQVWDYGPEAWVDADLPFPEGATEDFDEGYYFYEASCENPAGDRRLAWNYTEYADWDAGNSEWDVQNKRNVLLYTTNALDGHMDTKRFALSVDVGGEITGAAFLDDTQFIISTPSWSQYGQFILIGGQWIVSMGRKLEYGNRARNLVSFNETVYGLDQRDGLWSIGYDNQRQREDISPVGDQILLWNENQQDWFYRKYGKEAFRLVEADITVTPEFVTVSMPKMATAGAAGAAVRGVDPDGSNNVRRYSPGTGSENVHFWLTLYRGERFLSYDFAKRDSSYLPQLDPIVGPHGQVYWHTMTNETQNGGVYVWNRSRTIPVDRFRSTDDEIHTALEFGVPAPGFPMDIYQLSRIYSRIGAKGDTTRQTIYVTAAQNAASAVTLWGRPRERVIQSATQNGTAIEQYTDYTVGTGVNSKVVTFTEVSTPLNTGDTLTFTYYADVLYDVTITPVLLGDEKTSLDKDNNYREGVLNTEYSSWGEYFKVLVYNQTAEPLLLKGMTFYLGDKGQETQVLANEVITDTTGYGVYETTVPITE